MLTSDEFSLFANLCLPNISHRHSVPSESDALLVRKGQRSVCPQYHSTPTRLFGTRECDAINRSDIHDSMGALTQFDGLHEQYLTRLSFTP
jgi:hypothetical protein